MKRTTFMTLLGVSLMSFAEVASACDPFINCYGYTDKLVPFDGSTSPPNVEGFAVRFVGPANQAQEADFTVVNASTNVPVSIQMMGRSLPFLIHEFRFLESLEPETTYRVEWVESCEASGPMVSTFQTGPEDLALPESLGTLSYKQEGYGTIFQQGEGCETDEFRGNFVSVELDLSPTAEPWKDILVFQTIANGLVWNPIRYLAEPPGTSWVGRAKDRLYLNCDWPGQNLKNGRNTIHMEARLPGGETVFMSNSVEVEMNCEGLEPKEDIDMGDMGVGDIDMGDMDVVDMDVDGADIGTGEAESSSAGCSTTNSPANWMLFGLAFFWRLRRKLTILGYT